LKTEVCIPQYALITKKIKNLKIWPFSLFKNAKNHNWNNCITEEEKGVSALGESPCI